MATATSLNLKSLMVGATTKRVLDSLSACGCSDFYGSAKELCGTEITTFKTIPAEIVCLLWESYRASGCDHLREELILLYAPLVTLIAHKVGAKLPNSVEAADLVSYGMFGLIDAIDKYNVDREVKFETYASTRIRGSILDQLRAVDWVPRSVRSKAKAYDRAYIELEATLFRAPTTAELAERMEITAKELHQIQWQLSAANLVALDEVVGTGERLELISAIESVQRATTVDPAAVLDQQVGRALLASAIDSLNDREKIVVSLYYFKGRTLSEIGQILGVSESRVSQMHSTILTRLRASLKSSDGN